MMTVIQLLSVLWKSPEMEVKVRVATSNVYLPIKSVKVTAGDKEDTPIFLIEVD